MNASALLWDTWYHILYLYWMNTNTLLDRLECYQMQSEKNSIAYYSAVKKVESTKDILYLNPYHLLWGQFPVFLRINCISKIKGTILIRKLMHVGSILPGQSIPSLSTA